MFVKCAVGNSKFFGGIPYAVATMYSFHCCFDYCSSLTAFLGAELSLCLEHFEEMCGNCVF